MERDRTVLAALAMCLVLVVVALFAPAWATRVCLAFSAVYFLRGVIRLQRDRNRLQREAEIRDPDEFLARERREVQERLWTAFHKALDRPTSDEAQNLAQKLLRVCGFDKMPTARSLALAFARRGQFLVARRLLEDQIAARSYLPPEALEELGEEDILLVAYLSLQVGEVGAAARHTELFLRRTLSPRARPAWVALHAWSHLSSEETLNDMLEPLRAFSKGHVAFLPFAVALGASYVEEKVGTRGHAIHALRHFIDGNHPVTGDAELDQAHLRLAEILLADERKDEAHQALRKAARGRSEFASRARSRFMKG